MFNVLILKARPEEQEPVIFEGQASSVILPGYEGEFEVLDFHKPIISRLKNGWIVVDNAKAYEISGGVSKMSGQKLVAVVEQ